MVILKRATIISVITIVVLTGTIIFNPNSYATNYCTTEACKEAERKEAEAREKATEAATAAKDLEGVIQSLEQEIAAIEAKIAQSEKEVEDLSLQIKLNEEKLNAQQTALAALLVDMHFEENPDAIVILAGSNSISEVAERQSRQETVKYQVSQSAQKVREIKTELEKEKTAIERIIKNQQAQREAISEKRSEQTSLMEQYRDNAEAYTEEAEEARKKKDAEIQAYINEMLKSTGGGIITEPGLNSYPYSNECPDLNWRYTSAGYGSDSRFGGYYCECVSYTAWKVYEYWGYSLYWGDANNWGYRARNAGFTVNDTPEPYSVGYYTNSAWGHVVWVESVNDDGTINYSEYNGARTADFAYRTGVSASNFSYIHFK